jgi:hypothetical protein
MSKLTAEQQVENAVAKELWEWRDELYRRAEQWYPESVFPPVAKGETHKTVDGASAAMARHTLKLIASELGDRSIELTHDEPED